MYKLALKSALYDFTSARDFYRESTHATGTGMHRDLVLKYIELQALLLVPIAPHWAEYMWLEVLGKVCTIGVIVESRLTRYSQTPCKTRCSPKCRKRMQQQQEHANTSRR